MASDMDSDNPMGRLRELVGERLNETLRTIADQIGEHVRLPMTQGRYCSDRMRGILDLYTEAMPGCQREIAAVMLVADLLHWLEVSETRGGDVILAAGVALAEHQRARDARLLNEGTE